MKSSWNGEPERAVDGEAQASRMMDDDELQRVRHDLKNLLTALRSGCDLVDRQLQLERLPQAREILEEMRIELRRGREIVDRLHVPE